MRKVLVILGQLWDEDVEWLAAAGRRVRFGPGEVLIRQGCPVDSLFIVLDGHVAVGIDGLGELARLGSGEILGEMSMVDSRPPAATVTAADEVVVLGVSKDRLIAKLDTDFAFAARFYKALATFLSGRMRDTVIRLGDGGSGRPGKDEETDGEINLAILDNLHLAGGRFDRIIKRLLEI